MSQSPLQELFVSCVKPCFRTAEVNDPAVADYVADMLVRFVHSEAADQTMIASRPVADIGEMIAKADPVFGEAASFDEERRIHQHVGDAALFYAGLMPGSFHYRQARQHIIQSTRELMQVGRESYYIVSQFDVFEYRDQARLFSCLSNRFDQCVHGLSLVGQRLNLSH